MADAPALQVGLKVGLDMSLPLPLGALAAGSPGLLWQVALTRWAARQLAVSLSASPGQRASPGNYPLALEDVQESL